MNPTRIASALTLAVIAQVAAVAPVGAQPAMAQDRYGPLDAPTAAPPLVMTSAPEHPLRLRTRLLSWPGKSSAGPVAASAAALPPMQVRAHAGPSGRSEGRSEREPRRWPWRAHAAAQAHRFAPERASGPDRGAMQASREPQARPPLPASLYDRADPAGRYAPPPSAPASPAPYGPGGGPAPIASAAPPRAPYGGGVRFYSVHRQFGLQPDPAPIAPQFFASTPDLSDPPGPIANRRTIGAGGVSVVAARSAAQAEDANASAIQP